ncbi:Response regulator receiver domain-containing protein [Desulfonatronum thiosulfatophilum]|uniref:Response regulator receiver domain-containing protein n=1 Tax=Desulfonatronum thiosulfatophilum TaxID=617002 RepID=A0A1G6EEB1_9BACT|nr:response regulator [Desulfonatronum thiosulfatophilum]SDB55726.1 Response regulator receiver domain-containing protein [Desulfonatronum thiosulfatophilum]
MTSQKRVLIIEDDGILAMALESLLTNMGHVVVKAVATGEDGIVAVKDAQPELVLMDINLAGRMNGITAAEHIRSFSDIPIVYLTGHSEEAVVREAEKTKPHGFLLKPVLKKQLKTCLESL